MWCSFPESLWYLLEQPGLSALALHSALYREENTGVAQGHATYFFILEIQDTVFLFSTETIKSNYLILNNI